MSIEAMKQALEALEYGDKAVFAMNLEGVKIKLRQALSEAQLSVNENSHAIEQYEKQGPVAWKLEAGKAVWFEKTDPAATSALPSDYVVTSLYGAPQPQQTQKQKPWVWMPAPTKTLWANDMVEADLAIDKDHTVSVYCERDQAAKVEAMFKGKTT